ncbi:MAG: ATP-binding protein [Reyranellaceae bacterium]
MRRRGAGDPAAGRSPALRRPVKRSPAEPTAAQGKARHAALFESATVALAIVGRDGRVDDLNAACLEFLGLAERSAATGQPLHGWIDPDQRIALEAALASAFAGKAVDVECQMAESGAGTKWAELSLAPLRSGAGASDAAVVLLRDISRHRQAEERLREAEKLEAIGRLTGGVAHDFNNILTVIIGNSELLSERLAADEETRGLAEISLAAARAGADLTRMLLAYSRRQTLQPSEFCAADMLREVRGLLERSLGDAVAIEIEADEQPWGVVADRAQLASVLLNLSLNARDAMPRGGRILIEARNAVLDGDYARLNPETQPGEYVLLAVTDSGQGMPPHVLERAFEPFFTTKEVGKGSGLGLSMVYGFARQSGGHVKIYSEPGRGTVVRLYLPRAQVQLDLPNMDTEPASLSARAGETVMLVEDNAQVRDYVAGELRRLGYVVVTAADGKGALAGLRDLSRLDLLLSDIVMPGLDGLRLVERARRLRPGLAIMLMSGFTEHGLARDGLAVASGSLLSKPFSRLELARKVRAAIDGRLSS